MEELELWMMANNRGPNEAEREAMRQRWRPARDGGREIARQAIRFAVLIMGALAPLPAGIRAQAVGVTQTVRDEAVCARWVIELRVREP